MSRNLDARESDSPCNLAQTPIRSHDAPRVSIFSHLCRSKSPPPRPSPPLPPVHFLAVSHCNALLHPAVPNPYPPSNTSMPAMLGTSPNVTSPSQRMIRCAVRPALLLSVHAMSPFLLRCIIQAYELSTLTGSFEISTVLRRTVKGKLSLFVNVSMLITRTSTPLHPTLFHRTPLY